MFMRIVYYAISVFWSKTENGMRPRAPVHTDHPFCRTFLELHMHNLCMLDRLQPEGTHWAQCIHHTKTGSEHNVLSKEIVALGRS